MAANRDVMTFNVEVLLKGKEHVVDESVHLDGPAAADWADDNVRRILTLTLGIYDKVLNPSAETRSVSLQGFSWIVTPVDGGVVLAIEVSTGAVVAGPFDADADELTATIQRVLANGAASDRVH